jgi:hypothetical protein
MKAAQARAGIGAAIVIAFAGVLLEAVSFWERVAALAILGFIVGVVCFIYGRSYRVKF